jgi:heparin binding hemagglutinin HbhA
VSTVTESTTKTRFPAPLYAAAGAGDLAYQQLRKLPAILNEFGDKASASLNKASASLNKANAEANDRVADLRAKAGSTDFEQLRNTATSNAVAFAQAASERAIAIYTSLVAHGERVVGTGVVDAAEVVNADIEATEEPKAVAATPSDEPAPKPRKRARPAEK